MRSRDTLRDRARKCGRCLMAVVLIRAPCLTRWSRQPPRPLKGNRFPLISSLGVCWWPGVYAMFAVLGSLCYCSSLERSTLKTSVWSVTGAPLDRSRTLRGQIYIRHDALSPSLCDRVCVCVWSYIICVHRKQRGRLKVCSESILFDPVDFSDPVIKVN